MASADGNGAPASMKREGTMQRTVREAKDYAYGCKCNALDEEHDHDHETGQVVPKPGRQSTMEKTAQEGIQFLKDSRKDTLLEVQGLVPKRANRNKDADDDDDDEDDVDEDDDEDTGDLDDDDDEEPLTGENGHDDSDSGGPVKMAKHGTMLVTAKEGNDLLDNYMGGKPDPNARTRGQQKAHEDDEEDEDEPDAKKPRRTHTMQETAQEAHLLVSNPHSMGGTRSETAAVKKAEEEHATPNRKRKQ